MVVSDTGNGSIIIPFTFDKGCINKLAPVSTVNFNLAAPIFASISSNSKLNKAVKVHPVSFPLCCLLGFRILNLEAFVCSAFVATYTKACKFWTFWQSKYVYNIYSSFGQFHWASNPQVSVYYSLHCWSLGFVSHVLL